MGGGGFAPTLFLCLGSLTTHLCMHTHTPKYCFQVPLPFRLHIRNIYVFYSSLPQKALVVAKRSILNTRTAVPEE